MARPRGRKPIVPTADELRAVEHYVSIGYTQAQIAQIMGRSLRWLQMRCRTQLDNGTLRVNALVAGKLFERCMKGDTQAIMFWMRTRMGWKDSIIPPVAQPGTASLSEWWKMNGLPPADDEQQAKLPTPDPYPAPVEIDEDLDI